MALSSSISVLALRINENISAALFAGLTRCVSAQRVSRSRKFVKRIDALRSLAGEALARYCIREYTGMPNTSISFETNHYGKPYVTNEPHVHFNVSHSGDWVVCAVHTGEIGADVEEIHPIDIHLAQRFFCHDEWNAILSQTDPSDQLREFFTYWVLKESYIKALGQGLSCPLDSFSVQRKENGDIHMIAQESASPLRQFTLYELDINHPCSLCYEYGTAPGTVRSISLEEVCGVR